MQFNIPLASTKVRLISRLEVNPTTVLEAGTILSVRKIKNTGSSPYVQFYIPKKGCPANPNLEGYKIDLPWKLLEKLNFDLNTKPAKRITKASALSSALDGINKEIYQ